MSSCECGNENSDSIKCRVFLEKVRIGQLLKKDSTPWMYLISKTGTIFVLNGGFTNSPQTHVPPQQYMRQKSDNKQVPPCGPTDVRHLLTNAFATEA